MKPVIEFEIIDHGTDHAQYFQGCGVCFTEFDDVATGASSTPKEAFDEALEQLANNGWDVSTIDDSDEVKEYQQNPAWDSVPSELENQGEDGELYYYLSVRVK